MTDEELFSDNKSGQTIFERTILDKRLTDDTDDTCGSMTSLSGKHSKQLHLFSARLLEECIDCFCRAAIVADPQVGISVFLSTSFRFHAI